MMNLQMIWYVNFFSDGSARIAKSRSARATGSFGPISMSHARRYSRAVLAAVRGGL